MWFTGKLRASVKANNLLLKCKNGSDCVASNQIDEKTPRKTPNPVYLVPRKRFWFLSAL